MKGDLIGMLDIIEQVDPNYMRLDAISYETLHKPIVGAVVLGTFLVDQNDCFSLPIGQIRSMN